jgi:hypothetical protein
MILNQKLKLRDDDNSELQEKREAEMKNLKFKFD